jgi:phosphate/sulfate permease
MYLIFVIILVTLAFSDLIVGVSNDAVNFLNSAIGSRVATRRKIMVVASVGILLGALFSSGMMEVARKGIFHPEMFSFAEVMVIFLAVMLTDIILLDLFNTFGMPTSTTVSIVFELLGAAVVVAWLHVSASGQPASELVNYINSSKALLIVAGIFLSILVAFGVGAVVQYGSRMLFSFKYKKRIRTFGSVWGGLSLTILSYFLIIKGLKGASFVTPEFLRWVNSNALLLMALTMICWTILFQALISFTRVNILKVIVLAGTLSLAMAFASNDLVNFIGVPIAGIESFMIWQGSGAIAGDFLMTSLSGKVLTPSSWLIIAGFIMTITLWFSKKAKTVTETEVNLSRQHEGNERFKPHLLARLIVDAAGRVSKYLIKIFPVRIKNKIEKSFDQSRLKNVVDPPAFDLIRASVNLTVASMLIAIATSFKLPLSTTYVSFMVAMGTSLADRAWGNGNAVYRVAGVLNVIAGWFMTAIIAFSVAGFFALIIYYFELQGVIGLIIIGAVIILKFFKIHKQVHQKMTRGTLVKGNLGGTAVGGTLV